MPRRRGRYIPSRRYREVAGQVDKNKTYALDDALEVLKSGKKKCKFDESVDVAIKLGIDPKQADQLVRGSFSLPKGTGKDVRVIAFVEGAIADEAKAAGAIEAGGDELAKRVNDGWLDFDVAIAHPATMRFVGRLGRVLGPKGLMPSPKSGTVTPNVVDAVKEFKAGKLEFRNDSFGNIHVTVGKLSFAKEDLASNIDAFVSHIKAIRPQAVRGNYLEAVSVTSTMGPGLKLVL